LVANRIWNPRFEKHSPSKQRVIPGKHRSDWLLFIALICGALGWVFTMVGSVVTEGHLTAIDGDIRQYFLTHRSGPATAFFTVISMLGSKPFMVIVSAAVGFLISKRSKLLVVLVALCGLVSAEFVDVLKESFGVARPPDPEGNSRSLSFPSGHVTGMAAMAILLSYVAWRRKVATRLVIAASALMVILMALSRIYLDRHWASDTLGGVLIGTTVGLTCAALYEWFAKPAQREPSPS
jgi:membrane-associated phospholipid phosphatase